MDTLYINRLRVPASIGVHNWEQQIKQHLVIDVAMRIDASKAGQSDNLAVAVDYWQAREQIIGLLTEQSFKLIEAVAENIATLLLNNFATKQVTVKVAKPSVASDVQDVAIEITRAS